MLSNMKALLGLLIIIAGIAYYVTMSDSEPSDQAQFLMSDWQQNPTEIESITKVQLNKSGESISINKVDGVWLLDGGFFANTAPLYELFQSLQAAEIVEVKTANPKNHAQLELAEDDLKVSFYQAESKANEVHMGKSTSDGLVFVRYQGDDQTYTVSGLKPVSFNQDNWQLKKVLDYPADKVVKVKFEAAEGESFEVQRNIDDLNFKVVDIPDGFQVKADAQLNSLAAGLSQLMIDGALPVNLDGLVLQSTNSYQLTDGSIVKLQVYQKDETYFLTIDGENHQQFAPWLMKLAAYKFDALNKKLTDVIEAVDSEPVKVVDGVE